VLVRERGIVVRPMLGVCRAEVLAYLGALRQSWREDSSNQDTALTRNRIRHELLPMLGAYNPRIAEQLGRLSAIARDEEAYWEAELKRLLPGLLLPGRPVRGGGRAASTHPGEKVAALEVVRLRVLHPALQRRILRAAAKELGVALDFDQTARLLALVAGGPAQRESLTAELRAERTPRELQLVYAEAVAASAPSEYVLPIPGEVEGFGLRVRADSAEVQAPATLRAARPGDRVRLRYSSGPKKVKEVLERMGVAAADRAGWPVVEWQGEILWMRGAVLEASITGVAVSEEPIRPRP
jgi:tRNA(Ile)-lysidine synthase